MKLTLLVIMFMIEAGLLLQIAIERGVVFV